MLSLFHSVKANLVFIDGDNRPIDAVDSVKTLQDETTKKQLSQNGINVANVVVPEPLRPGSEPRVKGTKVIYRTESYCHHGFLNMISTHKFL